MPESNASKEQPKEPKWWAEPSKADICWAVNFPTRREGHKPKNRPCLIVNVSSNADKTKWRVLAVYATTNNTARAHEFIVGTDDRQVFLDTGLQSDTKFDLNDCAWMDFNDDHFGICPFGPVDTPRLGRLETIGTPVGERYRAAKSRAKSYPSSAIVEGATEKKKDP